jgi:ABC-type branched-subunit amino acid transport system substrate-binding protein
VARARSSRRSWQCKIRPWLTRLSSFPDHQNKPDLGAGLARVWFEQQGVDAIFDVPTSSVALAVNTVAGQDKKLVFFSTAIIDRITEEDCNGYGLLLLCHKF